ADVLGIGALRAAIREVDDVWNLPRGHAGEALRVAVDGGADERNARAGAAGTLAVDAARAVVVGAAVAGLSEGRRHVAALAAEGPDARAAGALAVVRAVGGGVGAADAALRGDRRIAGGAAADGGQVDAHLAALVAAGNGVKRQRGFVVD